MTEPTENKKKRSLSGTEEEEQERPVKRSTALTDTVVRSMTPRVDPFDGSNHQRRTCVIYLCLLENTKSFRAGLETCKQVCSKAVHAHCFQMAGTRHVSLWEAQMNDQEVATLAYHCRKNFKLPMKITFQAGWNRWTAGNYLGLVPESEKALKGIVQSMKAAVPASGKISCNHLSLYRKRGFPNQTATVEFQRVKRALAKHEWGSLKGVTIRIKELGSPYDECKVLVQAENAET